MSNKNELVEIKDQSGVELGVERLLQKNANLLADNINTDRIKNAAGFYIANRDDLMGLKKEEKIKMLYGILNEAMLDNIAGVDFDIVPFKGKATIMRKKDGWFKIINKIKPAEIVRFNSRVFHKEDSDKIEFNPITEAFTKMVSNPKTPTKYSDVLGAFAYIKLANGFEKTIYVDKDFFDTLKGVSAAGSSQYSPWNTMPMIMCETKVIKELAKKMFTLYSGNLEEHFRNAIMNDEVSVTHIDDKGNIKTDNTMYSENDELANSQAVESLLAINGSRVMSICKERGYNITKLTVSQYEEIYNEVSKVIDIEPEVHIDVERG